MKTSFNELKTRNILSKAEMQNVKGGAVYVYGGNGTCGVYAPEGRNFAANLRADEAGASPMGGVYVMGVSKADALAAIAGISGARWCCDSCGGVAWRQ